MHIFLKSITYSVTYMKASPHRCWLLSSSFSFHLFFLNISKMIRALGIFSICSSSSTRFTLKQKLLLLCRTIYHNFLNICSAQPLSPPSINFYQMKEPGVQFALEEHRLEYHPVHSSSGITEIM